MKRGCPEVLGWHDHGATTVRGEEDFKWCRRASRSLPYLESTLPRRGAQVIHGRRYSPRKRGAVGMEVVWRWRLAGRRGAFRPGARRPGLHIESCGTKDDRKCRSSIARTAGRGRSAGRWRLRRRVAALQPDTPEALGRGRRCSRSVSWWVCQLRVPGMRVHFRTGGRAVRFGVVSATGESAHMGGGGQPLWQAIRYDMAWNRFAHGVTRKRKKSPPEEAYARNATEQE